MKHRYGLLYSVDLHPDNASRYATVKEAKRGFMATAEVFERFGSEPPEAFLYPLVEGNDGELGLSDYPSALLSIGPRGGLKYETGV